MLTQCSQCKKTYTISVDELRLRRSALYCPNCEDMLSRLQIFSAGFFHPEAESSSESIFWRFGFLACLGLFCTQIYWVEGDNIKKNAEIRAGLEKICQFLQCKLPVYQNLDDFEILYSDLSLSPDKHYVFQAVISNQAAFSQAYPRIKLSFSDFSGHTFAQRVFYPADYLLLKPNAIMAAADSIEINLAIVPPAEKMGGYHFELL